MNKVYFVLILHAHQPVGNFEKVFERAYQDSYLPFLQALEAHPRIRLSMHYSGGLLQWIEHTHPEYFDLLRQAVAARQVELMGGGFYEPILTAVPKHDALEQIRRLSQFLQTRFQVKPKGIWLAERVWEPQLPSLLHEAGVEYLSVDDTHFEAAGLSLEELAGAYFTEDHGATLGLIPGSKRLRYLVPFHEPAETIELLKRVADNASNGLVAMADDLEKFGVWPHTHEHVYTNRWLERFLDAVESNQEWIEMVPAGEYLEKFPPRRRIYLPTASYPEMMAWALPVETQKRFEQVEGRLKNSPDASTVASFLRGGFFRNFLARYPEANLLHKRMLWVSRRFQDLKNRAPYPGPVEQGMWEHGYDHLLRAQANDPYWHGVFGGLYAPHLRLSAQRNLSLAESYADEMEISLSGRLPAVTQLVDFDADMDEELMISTSTFSALLDPHDGATLSFLDFKPAAMDVINSLARRPEAYHEKVLNLPKESHGAGAIPTIHERTVAKEANLHQLLIYDKYPRNGFRLMCFSASKHFEDFCASQLDADADLAGGFYELDPPSPRRAHLDHVALVHHGEEFSLGAGKTFTFSTLKPDELEITCEIDLEGNGTAEEQFVGLELVFNLMAPDEPDRYFIVGDRRESIRWQGTMENVDSMQLVDEYQKVKIEIQGPESTGWWVAPIFTVSQSEDGFEAVYQGSSILPHWKFSPREERAFHRRLVVRISAIE